MLILISCAKLMKDDHERLGAGATYHALFSEPYFKRDADYIASRMMSFSQAELSAGLAVNMEIAEQNLARYRAFGYDDNPVAPALFTYNGIVFKSIDPESLSVDDIAYAQENMFITSFLYGLLRPMDCIEPYRLEGKFCFDPKSGATPFKYWKQRLTEHLISAVERSGGVLCNLASGEMKSLFDWREVERRVEVLSPEFYTVKGGKRKTIVVHTKIARGLMSRYIIEGRVESKNNLQRFDVGGYHHVSDMIFVREL